MLKSKAFKAFIKPDDRVIVENPKEKKTNQYQNRSELEIYKQLESQYRVITENYTLKVIDLSFIANPACEEDMVVKQRIYKDIVEKSEVESGLGNLPIGKDENRAHLTKAVGKYDWIENKLDALDQVTENCQVSGDNLLKEF